MNAFIIENNKTALNKVKNTLTRLGFLVNFARSIEKANKLFNEKYSCRLVVFCPSVQETLMIQRIIRDIRLKQPLSDIIIVAEKDVSIEIAVQSIKAGANDFLTKPVTIDTLQSSINYHKANLKIKNGSLNLCDVRDGDMFLKNKKVGFAGIVGQNYQMIKIFDMVKNIHNVDSTVLISGETGTGKELLANAIHAYSVRKKEPFIVVNCAAFPETLLESELFGHEKGSFTGAVKRRIGKFEQADNGTVFIDEIGDIPLSVQLKLLRVMQEKQFERVGGEKIIYVNVRIIAATNKDLVKLIRENKFREDLYYRLHVIPVSIPPLRLRTNDIPALVQYFTYFYCTKFKKNLKSISQNTMDRLMNYHWPGNVRELENVIERAIVTIEDDELTSVEIPVGTQLQNLHRTGDININMTLKELKTLVYDRYEKKYLKEMLIAKEGRINIVAEHAGIDSKTLYERMKKFGLNKKNFR